MLPLVPNVRELGAQYSVRLGGVDRVAGYDARIVDILPRDPYRYGYRLWLQQGNQLLLRSAIVDEARRPLEQFMFVALDIGEKPSETDLSPAGNVGSAASPVDEMPITTKPFWNVADAPAGFSSGSHAKAARQRVRVRSIWSTPTASPAFRYTWNRKRSPRRSWPNRLSCTAWSASIRWTPAAST